MAGFSSLSCRSRSRWGIDRVTRQYRLLRPSVYAGIGGEDPPTDVVLGFSWFQLFAEQASGHQCESM